MILAKNSIVDGQLSFERGVETGRSPSRVPRNQLCLLVNGTTRDDDIGPRPGYKKQGFINANFLSVADKNAVQLGLFQGAAVYNPASGPSFLVASISGRLWKVTLGGEVSEITGYDGANSSIARQAWFCQAENYLIWQDGVDGAIIFDGSKAWRSRVDGSIGRIDDHAIKEVPTGTCMEYAMGRLWVALPDGRSFVAGDLVYGPSGTPALGYRDSVLRFSENTFLAEGGAFTIPANAGPIRAMRAVANLDTSLGQGPLLVFTTQACFTVNAPPDRTVWKDQIYPIQTISLIGEGALGQNSTQAVNGDVWYRRHSGIASFIMARRDFGQWGNRTMSAEVSRHIDRDQRDLLRYGSACLFDDRLLMTADPRFSRSQGCYHKGLVSLDFHPITSIDQSEAPTWDGYWTASFDIFQVLAVESEGVQRCFAFTLEAQSNDGLRRMGLQELTRDEPWDLDESGNRFRITTTFEGPRLDFAPNSTKLEQKILEGCDLWLSDVRGNVDIYLYYRPDAYPCWMPWKLFKLCAKIERCLDDAVDGCLTNLNLKAQYRPRLAALLPPSACTQSVGVPSNLGFEFQYRFEIVGHARVQAIRISARSHVEAMFGNCSGPDATCEEINCCQEPVQFDFPLRWTRRLPNSPGESWPLYDQVLTTEDNQAIQSEQGDNFNPRG